MIALFAIALAAGALTAFTPCALPVLPIVLSSGAEKDGGARVNGVIIGLVSVFVLTTLFLSTIVQALGISPDSIRVGSVFILLFLGLALVFPKIWDTIQGKIEKRWHPPVLGQGKSNFYGGLLTGGSLGVVWTPCVGPIVAAVTALTASSPFSFAAIGIAVSYGVGIGISLWFIAKGSGKAISKMDFMKKNSEKVRQFFGGIIVITALFIFFNGDRALQSWALEHLPEEWTQAGSLFQDNETVKKELQNLRK